MEKGLCIRLRRDSSYDFAVCNYCCVGCKHRGVKDLCYHPSNVGGNLGHAICILDTEPCSRCCTNKLYMLLHGHYWGGSSE